MQVNRRNSRKALSTTTATDMIFNFYAWIVADLDRMNVVLDTVCVLECRSRLKTWLHCFIASLIQRWCRCPHPLSLGLLCDLLWPTACGRSDTVCKFHEPRLSESLWPLFCLGTLPWHVCVRKTLCPPGSWLATWSSHTCSRAWTEEKPKDKLSKQPKESWETIKHSCSK